MRRSSRAVAHPTADTSGTHVVNVDARSNGDDAFALFSSTDGGGSVGNHDNLIRVSRGMHDYLQKQGVPHIWRVDTNGHDTTEMSNSLYHFAQLLFRE